jgi:uncharacterized membrane protein
VSDDDAVELPIDGVLDLHTFSPKDASSLVGEYLDECKRRGIFEIRIVHGKGKGVLRRIVHAELDRRDDVRSYALAPPERGGWGATLVTLEGAPSKPDPMTAPGEVGASRRDRVRAVFRWVLAIAMVAVGALHFVNPDPFVEIVPPYLPAALALVYLSGVFEIAGGVGLLVPRTRRAAAFGLIALYVAVFPANIQMAIQGDDAVPDWALYLRLPFQVAFIAWAYWVRR